MRDLNLSIKLNNGFILNEVLVELFEFGSNSVVILSPEGEILYANPLFITNTEYDKDELLKLNFRDLLTPTFIDKFNQILASNLAINNSWRGEIEHLRKDQSIYWTTSYCYKLKKNSKEIGLFIFENDISSIKDLTMQLENKANQLYEEKFKIETILNNIPYGVIVIEPDGSIIYINKNCNELFRNEFKRTLLINSNLKDYSSNDVVSEILKLINSKESKEITITLQSNKHWQITFLNLVTPDDENLFITVIRDISSFIEFEQIQKQFVTSVSHELRTPIASILLSINNYISFRDKLDKEQNESLLKIIKQNANILKNIVEDLLIISHIDNKKLKLRSWKEIEVNKIINESILQLRPLSDNKNIKIRFNNSSRIILYSDEERFSQIIRIPLENAIKYSHFNSEISISLVDDYKGLYNSQNEGGILLSIQDFGIGIKKKELKFTFKRFFRGSNVQTIQGTGIGLSILKELIQLLKGNVFIESEESMGTKVLLFFPKLKEKP